MIKKIIEHKIRNGALAVLTGLFIAVAALYMDVFRGDTSGTIGMYQIVGSLTGYMISGIGAVLIMKETEVRKTVQNILFGGGVMIVAISIFADYLGVTGPFGLDKFQVAGIMIGLVIIAFGFFSLPQRLFGTRHYTLYRGDVASFRFSGTQFILTYTQDAGQANYDVYVDHHKIATISADGTVQLRKTYTSPVFSAGTHLIEFKNIGKTKTVMNVESIQSLDTAMPGTGIYDDTHFNWSYTGSWSQSDVIGPFNNTLHYALSAGDKASFRFKGTQFILIYTQDTNRANYVVYMDGSKIASINANGALQWQKAYTSPIFFAGIHLVEIKNIGGIGEVMDVDAIEVLDTAVPAAGTYDDTHFNWIYSGSWALYENSRLINNILHYTLSAGDVASFRFSGTQFILIYTQDTNRANYEVYVDNIRIATINANGDLQWQKTYTSPILPAGIHLVEFKNAGGGGGVMDIDAIEIK